MLLALEAILGHRSAHSLATGPAHNKQDAKLEQWPPPSCWNSFREGNNRQETEQHRNFILLREKTQWLELYRYRTYLRNYWIIPNAKSESTKRRTGRYRIRYALDQSSGSEPFCSNTNPILFFLKLLTICTQRIKPNYHKICWISWRIKTWTLSKNVSNFNTRHNS